MIFHFWNQAILFLEIQPDGGSVEEHGLSGHITVILEG